RGCGGLGWRIRRGGGIRHGKSWGEGGCVGDGGSRGFRGRDRGGISGREGRSVRGRGGGGPGGGQGESRGHGRGVGGGVGEGGSGVGGRGGSRSRSARTVDVIDDDDETIHGVPAAIGVEKNRQLLQIRKGPSAF